MDFIKNFLMGAAKFAYALFVSPIVEVKEIFSKTTTWGQKLIKLVDAASRVIIIASWFFAVPALLVTLAWVWFWVMIVAATLYAAIVTLSSSAGLAFLLMLGNRIKENQSFEQSEEAVPAAA